ncbi:MAG TPA: VTT domain-containing protein [Candidatus Bathyarchaeia archaeon]|nr:VTT domain-containing protein [Candidatus Bathyarchaeia archaeon]
MMLQIPNLIALMQIVCMQFGYIGVLIVSLAGALSIFIPVPDTIAIFTLAGLRVGGGWVFEPMLLALAAAVGGAIGNLAGYILGLSSGKAITGRFRKNLDFLAKILNRFGAFAIFAFALTPLPDDLIFIPLGVKRYNPIKAVVSAMMGKFLLCLGVAYGARFSISLIMSMLGAGTGLVSVLVSTTGGIALTIALFKVDWAAHFEKHMTKMNDEQKYFDCSCFSQKELQLRIATFVNDLTREKSLFGKDKISLAVCLERVRLTAL